MIATTNKLVVMDLCAALIAPRLKLEAAIKLLQNQGVEVAIYSALDAWTTRRALRLAGIMEWYDYVWHMDAMMQMRADELVDMSTIKVLNMPEQLTVKQLCEAAGIPPTKVPPWLRWAI